MGSAVAARLAASGASVGLWDSDGEKLSETAELGGNIHTSVIDVTDDSAVDRAALKLKEFGRIDIMVNSVAGISGPNAPTWQYGVADWRRVIDIDLNGTFLCCRAAVPYMLLNNYGRIVNIASVAGKEGNPNAAAYSAAKAGVIGLTKSLGKELAETGIAVNCVTPAAVKTDIFDQMTEEHITFMLSKNSDEAIRSG